MRAQVKINLSPTVSSVVHQLRNCTNIIQNALLFCFNSTPFDQLHLKNVFNMDISTNKIAYLYIHYSVNTFSVIYHNVFIAIIIIFMSRLNTHSLSLPLSLHRHRGALLHQFSPFAIIHPVLHGKAQQLFSGYFKHRSPCRPTLNESL